MSETSTAKRFEQQQKNLIALLSKTTSRKSGGALPERGAATSPKVATGKSFFVASSSPSGTREAKLHYQSEISDRVDFESILEQANHDHEQALKAREREICMLKSLLSQKKDMLDSTKLRERTIKYYGSLLTGIVESLASNTELIHDEDHSRHMLKVSSTLSYLLNDGNITQSIQKEVSMTEALDEAVEEKMKMKAISASLKNRRGSINAVPFESHMLYHEPTHDSADLVDEAVRPAQVSKNRRGTLNAVPFTIAKQGASSSPRKTSIDDMAVNVSTATTEPRAENENDTALAVSNVICHCRELVPFRCLEESFEKKCASLFDAIYRRSLVQVDEKSKEMHVRVDNASDPLDFWIGKSTFLNFLFATDNIDSKLTMQSAMYCFDKAASESLRRGNYKLSLRLYFEEFISALSYAASFKKGDGVNQRENLVQFVCNCVQSAAMKDEMIYYEFCNIFKYCKSPDMFSTLSNAQHFLLKTYKRFVNYSCCIDPGGKKIKKYSPAGLESINPDTEEYNGKSFYQFCKTFHIFPVLTQESTCRRVTQHVRKISSDSNNSFFACLIYLSLSLARNTDDLQEDVQCGEILSSMLCSRMTSIIERVVVHIENEALKLNANSKGN